MAQLDTPGTLEASGGPPKGDLVSKCIFRQIVKGLEF